MRWSIDFFHEAKIVCGSVKRRLDLLLYVSAERDHASCSQEAEILSQRIYRHGECRRADMEEKESGRAGYFSRKREGRILKRSVSRNKNMSRSVERNRKL